VNYSLDGRCLEALVNRGVGRDPRVHRKSTLSHKIPLHRGVEVYNGRDKTKGKHPVAGTMLYYGIVTLARDARRGPNVRGKKKGQMGTFPRGNRALEVSEVVYSKNPTISAY